MSDTITFGIILPTYNRLELLQRAINSLINQAHQNWFCVIIDDSTNNETSNYFNNINSKSDSRIHYIKNAENKGVNYTRNRGIDWLLSHVKNLSYITFFDDDNVYQNHTLTDAAEAINDLNQPNWLMAPVIDLNNPSKSLLNIKVQKPIYHYVKDYLTRKCLSGDGTHYINPKIMQDLRFNDSVRTGGEWQFFAKLSNKSPINYINKGSLLANYLEDGLTKLNKSNLVFQAQQTKAVYDCVCEHGLGNKEKMRFAVSHIKSLVKNNQAEKASVFIKNAKAMEQLPPAFVIKLKLKLLIYRLKH